MKVLFLISSKGVFGAENSVLELSKQLLLSEFEPHIGIIENRDGSHHKLKEAAQKNNLLFIIFPCSGKFDLRTIREINNYIAEKQIHILHSQGYKSNFYSLLSGKNTKIKRITTCHNWLGNGLKMKFYEYLDKILLNRFDKIITVSSLLKDEILKRGISKDKIMVINNGVAIEKFDINTTDSKKQIGKTLGIKENEKVVGTVGRLSIEKGHIYLLKAFKKVISIFPSVKLIIIGDGPLRENLELKVRNLGLKDKVIFTGVRNDIPNMLSIMDIFVLPSLKEGVPMALLEAMAAKRAIVATRVGEVPKLIEHNKTGLLIEPKDENTISESIILLLKNSEKAKFISSASFERVKSEFSSSAMAEKYIGIYKELLESTVLGRQN